jgi:hypothetical protein
MSEDQAKLRRNMHRLAAFFAVMIYAVSSYAADSGATTRGDWTYSTAFYLWMANIDGKQTVKGHEADLDVSFGDILDVLEFAAEGHVEAIKNNQWGVFIDGTYLKLGPEADEGPINLEVDYQYWLWELGGLYRANTWTTRNGQAAVDLLLGGRYTSMDVELDFKNLPIQDVGGDESWTDLFVGARLLTPIFNNWTMSLRGDVGGFGIGGSSDLALHGALVFDWNFSPNWDLVAGFRALYQDYKSGSGANKFAYDATTYGPLLGVAYRF